MELMRQRVRVSFDFDVCCNNDTIREFGNNSSAKLYDLALLDSFLVADKPKLMHMMVDAIGTELGLDSSETFVETFLPQIDTNSHVLFSRAIDALRGDTGNYWRETRAEDQLPWGDVLTLATEQILKCFSAKFVASKFQTIDGDASWTT